MRRGANTQCACVILYSSADDSFGEYLVGRAPYRTVSTWMVVAVNIKNSRMLFRPLIFVALVTLVTCQGTAPRQSISGCVLEPVPFSDGKSYRTLVPGVGYRNFPCPQNTKFDTNKCVCDWVDNPVNPPGGDMATQATGPLDGSEGPITPPITTTTPPCEKRPLPDRHLYEEFVHGFDWMVRRCPMGTLYTDSACACHDFDPNQVNVCAPQLWINFNGREIEDSAGQQISIGNNGNVVNVSSAGRFDGTGTLTVWQYANQDLGTELTINLRLYEFPGGASEEQVLVSNCYGRRLGSVEIAINQVRKEIIFRGDATLSEPAEIRLPYPEKSWKNVTLSYNGQMLTGKVNEEIKSAPLKGHLSTRYNGILIGSCNGRGYVGYIDDLRIYRCLLDGDTGNMGMAGIENNLGGAGMAAGGL